MINLGLIDILLLVILIVMLVRAIARHTWMSFYVTLVLVLFIEIERLAPGTLNVVGKAIREIDTFNKQLPHVEILPIITIK